MISYPPAAFADLVGSLIDHGVSIVAFEDLLRGESGVALTFDDGMRSVFTEALPVIRDHDVPAHVFVTTGAIGGTNEWPSQPAGAPVFDMMSWDEVGACLEGGFTVESHTVDHPDFRTLEAGAIEDQCERADAEITERLGVVPTLMAYPYGGMTAAALAFARDRYQAAFSTTLGYLPVRPRSEEWRFQVPRLDTYYLKHPLLRRRLASVSTRGYLALRALLRRLRGST